MKLKNNLSFEKIADLIVKSWITYLFFVFAVTELLSSFNLIGRTSVIITYSTVVILVIVFLFKNTSIDFKFLKKIKKSDKLIIIILVLTILLPLLFTALYYPPNNWDSMTYHMARIMHWIDNKNVNFYFTHNDRQLFSGPLAEYVILHWYLLVDSDILSNLVQYFSLIITALASYLITKLLSKDKKINLLSIVLVLTTPMAIMQATSTQNDLVVSSILLATIYLGFKKSWLLFGLSIGLGMLTKNTYAIFALPFCIYFGIMWLKEYKQKALPLFSLFLLCVIFINSMHWYRNYQEFASLVGPKHMSEKILNTEHSSKLIISNMIRNFGLQIGLPNNKYNLQVDKIAHKLHEIIKLDTNDSRNSWYSMNYQTQFAIHEDLSGNFLLAIILILSFLLIFKEKGEINYAIIIISGWVIFNYLLKWQPWGSRLLLPWLLASIPLIASVLNKIITNNKVMLCIIFVLLFFSWPFVAGSSKYFGNFKVEMSSNRQILPLPEFGRKDIIKRYFFGRQKIYKEFLLVEDILNKNNVKKIGLNLAYDSWEYEWWLLVKKEKRNIEIDIIENNPYSEYQLVVSGKEECQIKFDGMELLSNENGICVFKHK